MQWVRTNRRFGAWCALAAITLQIVLSFGHAHRIEGFGPAGFVRAATAIHAQAVAEQGDPASKATKLALDYCAICVVIKMGAAAVPPEAPAWDVPIAAAMARFAPLTDAAASNFTHLLFQARAPPSA